MKHRRFFLVTALITLLAGCGKVTLSFNEGSDVTPNNKKGTLGEFSLVAPANEFIVDDVPTFSWTASENAYSYTLEVCSEDTFDNNSKSVIYTVESNVQSTSFKLSATLKRNTWYFWRVTAVNEFNSKSVGKTKISEVRKFYYQASDVGEIEIPVGEAGDWALHKVGSEANISIDHNDFFGSGNDDSLKITFEKEKTSQGPGHEKSDGWIVVQKAVDRAFFGPDALFLNFYYMGHDSTILIRIIDEDGELWYKQVKFTQDSRQMALLKFDEFILRTGDTVVQNETFDHEYIQAIEVCFERTFGDGCCIVSGIKAVKFDDYKDFFITKLNFNSVPLDKWLDENYKFGKTIGDDGYSLKLEYTTDAGYNGNEKGFNSYGYAFAKIPVDKYFTDGNAIRVKVKYSGYVGQSNAIIRIYEPDKDRWSYTHPYSLLPTDDFQELTIPYMAFDQSSITEGKRQFYAISQIQFGLNNCYGTGSITYKDFEIVTIPPVSENPRTIGNDGIIDDFEGYDYRCQMYEQWETSVANKDEGMFVVKDKLIRGNGNTASGKFTYKSDMSMATYDIYTKVEAQNLNALKFWIKDSSSLSSDNKFKNENPEFSSPEVTFQLVFSDQRYYRYTIEKAPRLWTEYVIPFTAFKLYDGPKYLDDPLLSQNVVNFAFGMQFFYKYNDKGYPVYTQNNPVYFDNIMFTTATEVSTSVLEIPLHPDANKVTMVDNFEYASTAEINDYWYCEGGYEYENIELSNDVSTEGGSHSMKLDYKWQNSPKYAHYPNMGNDVECKALVVDIKGDDVCTMYINLYFPTSSGTLNQYRYTLNHPASGWNRYVIGLGKENWKGVGIADPTFKTTSMQQLYMVTFGVKNDASTNLSSVYVDNLHFELNGVTYDTNTVTPLAVE